MEKDNFLDGILIKPCVGCGHCCITAKCSAGQRLYKSSDVCNALIWSEEKNRYICDLMELPGILGEEYRKELYAGEGCCQGLNSWRNNVIKREEKKKIETTNLDPFFQIFLRSLGRQWLGGDVISLTIYDFQDELLKRNLEDYKVKQILTLTLYHLKNQRDTMLDGFMGEISI